ncbi:MAG: DUF4231 domain-containing protein [Chloroflexi bacterium]|nr:DUF4231 domain-containing protein [Chloroflexota bacterium]
MAARVTKKQSLRRDLFFFRRRPKLRGISMDWNPVEGDDLQQMLESDGFVSDSLWQQYDISRHPVIAQDLRDLRQHLIPTFYEFSQKAKYFQNRYYLYQWVFIWGAFLTTVFGTLTTYAYNPFAAIQTAPAAVTEATAAPGQPGAADAPAASSLFTAQAGGGTTWSRLFGYLTAILGAVTAFFTALSNRGEPQKRWAKNRRLTEELRMHYFKYLAHLPPYDKPDRVQRLREFVIDSRIKEQENVG